jgi:aquaporin Z|tara:strand:- start:1559 stop:2197 length:639 start_codon:yes stop_codon:yes gene_type:complete
MNNTKKLICEFIGTFALVFMGAGSVLNNNSLIEVALSHGFTVIFIIYLFGKTSGAHINPAITFAIFIAKKINTKLAIYYVFFQLLGASFASLILFYIFNQEQNLNFGAVSPNLEKINIYSAFIIEITLTFFLAMSVLIAAIKKKAGSFAGIVIGFTLITCILIGGPLTGASLNPARTFGPALITYNFTFIWLYILAPLIGAFIASKIYKKII